MMKKRWNVAVSRARDQLWLVHSFDPAAQLKPDDLRRSLFDWADGVMSGTIGAAEPFDLPDPEFTGQVLRALRKRGYRVEAGHDAGAWRLDMVVRARGRAAAIECDGSGREDEDAIRRDMERQTVLERAGWKFVRVRSADWFRRPEKTLERVCEALAALGIAPEPEDCAPQTDLLLAHVRANVERLEAGLDMIVFDKEDEDPVPPVAPVTPADLAPDDAEPVVTTPVQFEAPLMPVEVEKADIMLIPEMEMRDAVRISLPTLSDVFDDEPAAEADAKTEDEAPNEPAAESCGDPHHTPVTFMEVIRDGLMDRGINPVLQTTPQRRHHDDRRAHAPASHLLERPRRRARARLRRRQASHVRGLPPRAQRRLAHVVARRSRPHAALRAGLRRLHRPNGRSPPMKDR